MPSQNGHAGVVDIVCSCAFCSVCCLQHTRMNTHLLPPFSHVVYSVGEGGAEGRQPLPCTVPS